MEMQDRTSKIQDYFLVGDLHTAALISKQGSIDWLCFPDFDSPSIFSRILDREGGAFSLIIGKGELSSKYLKHTAIVEHLFKKSDFECVIKDFMVPQPKNVCDIHFLIRKIVGLKGEDNIRFNFLPKPGYAKKRLNFSKKGTILSADYKEYQLHLHLPQQTKVTRKGKGYYIELKVDRNQSKSIVFEYKTKQAKCGVKADYESQVKDFWRDWVSKGRFIKFCKEEMIRSAITLKLLQYYPTGAIIAAPTTSLPEVLGGIRNWDYRYVWIRDATFTLYAFYILGYKEELLKFFDFVEDVAEGCKQCGKSIIHLMYTVKGSHVPKEKELRHLKGFKNSSPVRIGNDAFNQFQLDVYGSLIDSYYFMWRKDKYYLSDNAKGIILTLAEHIEDVWKKKDNGIWETRKSRQHFTYSKVMAWVGIDRVTRMADSLDMGKEKKKKWQNLSEEIKKWVWDNCFDEQLGSFVQYPGSKNQDATNLLFVLIQFLDRNDAKTKKIIDKTCGELSRKKSFVYRYLADDGIKGNEGAFVLCTFWLIAALAAVGRIDEAMGKYDRFKECIDDTGLMSEEIDTETREYLGNFPQSFPHMGLVLAASFVKKYKQKQGRN